MNEDAIITNIRKLRNRKLTQGRSYPIGGAVQLAYTITNQYVITWGDNGHVLHVASTEADALDYAAWLTVGYRSISA